MQKKKASDSIIFDIVLQLSFFVGFRENILQSGACRLRECFFKHALARKTSKKLKKYLAKTFFFVYNKFIHGWIPEWPKGTDCKSAGDAFEGSNPSPSI